MKTKKTTKRFAQNPLRLLVRALALWIGGRLKFEKGLGDIAMNENGEAFRAFRKVVVVGNDPSPEPPAAIFKVRFAFKNLTPKTNRRLSLIPIPFIAAQPGFRSKTWLLGELSGDFMGYYEFDNKTDAEAYWDSLPLRMMRRRARAGSLSCEIRDLSAEMGDTGRERSSSRAGNREK
jgi:hypothetical protein